MARVKQFTTRVAHPINIIPKGSKPPIWRRIQVPSATTLTPPHDILLYVLSWEGSCLTYAWSRQESPKPWDWMNIHETGYCDPVGAHRRCKSHLTNA